ncbi:unnamed protein product [Anisakis simplex]|uniref:Coiled-coil-helix-coiled-coil-helix domain-containing protein 6 n=1 Tax=Anisakis simplex TaxID=6269 RepID=A0A0M3KG79_ANISI|nr:unnamed protein product [Anisakis simplex]
MGAGQSQEQASNDDKSSRADEPQRHQPSNVVRIERTEIPEEYRAVGVSRAVVNRVMASQPPTEDADKIQFLREKLNEERAANERLREQVYHLTELQQKQSSAYVPNGPSVLDSDRFRFKLDAERGAGKITLEEMEERKRVFNETIERVERMFFDHQLENVCESNEKDIMECLQKNKTRLLNCSPLVNGYENCVAEMRSRVLSEVQTA